MHSDGEDRSTTKNAMCFAPFNWFNGQCGLANFSGNLVWEFKIHERYQEMVLRPNGCLARTRTSSWNTFQVSKVKTFNSDEPKMLMSLTFLGHLCCVFLDDWLNLRFVVWAALTIQIVLCIHSLWVATALVSLSICKWNAARQVEPCRLLFALWCKIQCCFGTCLSPKTFKDGYQQPPWICCWTTPQCHHVSPTPRCCSILYQHISASLPHKDIKDVKP